MPSRASTNRKKKNSSLNEQTKADLTSVSEPKAKRSRSAKKHSSDDRLADLLSTAVTDGNPLRWGLATAIGGSPHAHEFVLSELGCGNAVPKKFRAFDLTAELNSFLPRLDQAIAATTPPLMCLVDALMWAYSLPLLQPLVGEAAITSLHGAIDQLARRCISIADASSLARLVGGGELGLVLAWRFPKQTDNVFVVEAADCVTQWCESPEPSLGFAVQVRLSGGTDDDVPADGQGGVHARIVMASLIRAKALCAAVAKRKLNKSQLETIKDLAAWIAASTRVGGTAAFSTAISRDVRDDTARGGLFDQIKLLDPKTLGPALDAATGRSHTGGRIAWQISLPEAFCHSELGGNAVFLPEWDVRRGRLYLDYGGSEVRLQLDAGKQTAIDGTWELLIQVDEQEQAAAGPWTSLCEYTDDDVHYLELEQRWSGDIKVQRHLLVIREDRCVMLADAVIRDEGQPAARIAYTSRIKLADSISAKGEAETTEVWLQDKQGKCRGMALSLQSNEWRVGPTRARLDVTADANLRLEVRSDKRNGHGGNVFAPLWIDFQHRRFKRARTWRQLTVAEDLRVVDPDESVAYRVQQGSEQWVVYRMLNGDKPRTFLGKHLLADLFCARFHPSDGNMEDLVTVSGNDDEDEHEATV